MERPKRPIMRIALVGGLLATTAASGYVGYRTFMKKPTPSALSSALPDANAAGGTTAADPNGSPAPPTNGWENRRAKQLRTLRHGARFHMPRRERSRG